MNHRPTHRTTRPRRLGRAGSSDRFVATAITAAPFLALLALLFAVGAAWAQGVSINGGEVYAGNGCAKAGPVTAGDCEKGGKDGGGDGDVSSPGEQGGDEGSGPEATAPEITALETTAPEATIQETTQLLTVPEGTTAGFGESASPAPAPETAPEGTASSSPAPDEGCAAEGPMGETSPATVERVVDGDTLETSEGTVRLIGVDTPETVDPDRPPEPGGEEASDFTTEALEGEEVQLEIGEDPEDDYDRALAYAWTDEGMFNEALLREGMGELLIIPPNDAYEECLAAAEEAARGEGLGVWGSSNGSSSTPEGTDFGTTQMAPETPAADTDGQGEGRPGILQTLFGGGEEDTPEPAGGATTFEATTFGPAAFEDTDRAPSAPDAQYDEPEAQDEDPGAQDEEIQQTEIQDEEMQETEIQEEETQDEEKQDSEVQEPEVQEPEVQEEETQEGLLPSSPRRGPETAAPEAELVAEPVAEPAALKTPAEEAPAEEAPAEEAPAQPVQSAQPAQPAQPAPTQTIGTLPETGGPSPALPALRVLCGTGLVAAGSLCLFTSLRRHAAHRG